jgi:hypothetical protein
MTGKAQNFGLFVLANWVTFSSDVHEQEEIHGP